VKAFVNPAAFLKLLQNLPTFYETNLETEKTKHSHACCVVQFQIQRKKATELLKDSLIY